MDVNKIGDAEEPKKTAPMLSLPGPRLDMQSAFPRSGRALAVASLMVALLSGGLTLFMWKEMAQMRAGAALAEDALSDRLVDLESADSARNAALEEARQGSEEVARQNAATQSVLEELRTRVTRDRGDWLLAETEFLLSTANRKLRFDRDLNSAVAALEEADDRLQMVNDPSLVPVRATIARDLQALGRVPSVDRTSLTLELSALIESAGELPLAQPLAPLAASAGKQDRPPVSGWHQFFAALWSDIKGLVTIHRLAQPKPPLLPPEQRFFLHQNLSLKLEAARVALLQREPAAYEGALREARTWLSEYFDPNAPSVRAALEQLGRLQRVEIAPALPDIGDSLRQLRRLKRELTTQVRPEGER